MAHHHHNHHDVANDQFAVIQIKGMHCHTCERTIAKLLSAQPGVFEVEVDFNSSQASLLFDRTAVAIDSLLELVNEAGYRATGFVLKRSA